MSTGLIVAIVVIAIIIIALLVLLPRMRAAADRKKAERELHSRRESVAEEHRQVATHRETRAEEAEQRARLAQQEAQRERAEANLHHEHASRHERGMADDELIGEDERDRFAHVSGTGADTADREPDTTDTTSGVRSGTTDGDTTPDETPGVRSGTSEDATTDSDYERGREDERFERSRITDDVRESDRPRNS